MATIIENLFEKNGIKDSKHILNLSNEPVDTAILNKIESGVTVEQLDAFNLPVCKYQTQITIHGIFDKLSVNHIGNYKNLFQNKNKSIGVKYNAIDFDKKKHVYKLLASQGWHISRNSTQWHAVKYSTYFQTKEEYINHLADFQKQAKAIDTSLFYGGVYINLCKVPFRGYFIELVCEVVAIYQSKIPDFILSVCNKFEYEIEAEILKAEAKREAEYEAAKKERAEKRATNETKINERLSKIHIPFIEATKHNIVNGGIYMSVQKDTDDCTFQFVYYKFSKTDRQRDFRVSRFYSDVLITDITTIEKNLNDKSDSKTITSVITGFIVSEPKKDTDTKQTVKQAIKETVKSVIKPTAEIINYSDKAIAVVGDTKAIKDTLKELGGKWNPYLSCGAGWIFSKTKEQQVKNLLA